jgi:hypothetical protein
MNTLDQIFNKYNLKKNHYEIPNVDREDLAKLFNELNFKRIVEVGVCFGIYSEVLCKNNPSALVFGIDPFLPYKGYNDYKLKSTINSYHEKAKKLVYKYPNYTLIEKFSMDALSLFPDESLDAVYIDANHENPWVSDDIREWTKKVRSGGIVSGHDYVHARKTNFAVKTAVEQYVKENDKTLFIWGWEAKVDGMKRENSRSWMFIK